MPGKKITRADKEIITQPSSPCTNRSGFTRHPSVNWSSETTLRDVANEAHRNMTRMSQEINNSSQKTPENTVNNKTSTPRTGNASVNLTSHSSIKPGINTPSPSVTGASATKSTPKSPAVESTTKKPRTVIEPDFNYDSESESNSDQQEWKDNVQNATSYRSSSTYRRRMTEEDWGPPISERDLEGLITELNLERTNRYIQGLQLRQEAETRARSHSPTTPR